METKVIRQWLTSKIVFCKIIKLFIALLQSSWEKTFVGMLLLSRNYFHFYHPNVFFVCSLGKACRCTLELNEVCGEDGKSFGSPCMAKCEGVKVKCKGPCPCQGMFIAHYLSLTAMG